MRIFSIWCGLVVMSIQECFDAAHEIGCVYVVAIRCKGWPLGLGLLKD